MLMLLASVLDQMDLALEHIQKGSVHDAGFDLAAGMSGFRNGSKILERTEWRRKAAVRTGVPRWPLRLKEVLRIAGDKSAVGHPSPSRQF